MWPLYAAVVMALTRSDGHAPKFCYICNGLLGEFYNKGRVE